MGFQGKILFIKHIERGAHRTVALGNKKQSRVETTTAQSVPGWGDRWWHVNMYTYVYIQSVGIE